MKKCNGKRKLRDNLILGELSNVKTFLHMLVISYGIKKIKTLKGKNFRNRMKKRNEK